MKQLDHEISLIESNYLKKKKTLHISICAASSHYPLIGCDSTLNRKTVELVLVSVFRSAYMYLVAKKGMFRSEINGIILTWISYGYLFCS